MATIYSEKFAGTKHWSDPSAWVGGVVPTGSDVAYIESGFTRINMSNGVRVWSGVTSSIQVDSTAGFPDTSGSFYAYTYQTADYVKIDYDLRNGDDYFVNCTIDHSYVSWSADFSGSLRDGKAYGTLRNNAPVFRTDHTYICLSGSSEWYINRIHVRDHACFEIKDTATLKLDSTSQDSYVAVQDAKFVMKDQTSAILANGSTERNSSLVHSNAHDYQQIIISGSTDNRTRTTVSSNVATGSGVIPVASSTGFAAGDFISVYGDDDYITQKDNRDGTNNEYDPYYYDTTGSIWPYYRASIEKNEDETLYVRGINGNNLNVSKIYAEYGTIISASSAISKRTWQRAHGRSKSQFTGNKTKIQVRSGDNAFKAGHKVLIGNNVYTVLEVGDVLIPNKDLDFEAGANLNDFWIDSFIGSGSSNEFKIHQDLVTGSRLEMSGSGVAENYYYKSVFLKDFRLRDLKVTITGSILRQETNAYGSSGNYDGSRMFGVSTNADPHDRDRVLTFYNRPTYSRDSFIGIYGDDIYWGQRQDHWGRADMDVLIQSSSISGITTGSREGDVVLTIDTLREEQKFYAQGQLLNTGVKRQKHGTVALHLRHEGSCIKKMTIEEYVQELVLDTTDSISVNTPIYRTGTEVLHPSGQQVVKLASTISDLRGFDNIPARYSQGGSITDCVVPYHWSNNSGDFDLHRNSSTTDNRSRIGSVFADLQHYDYYYRIAPDGDAYWEINLGKEVTLDAIGLSHYYSMPSHYNTATIDRVGVEYSLDAATWNTAKANAADSRKSIMAGDYRIYQFSAVTARFLRINVSGTSANQRNYINAFGFYHFNGRGNTIEVNNASDIGVGDTIYFFNPTGHRGAGYISGQLQSAYRSDVISNNNFSDYVGHAKLTYTVNGKSGNVLTLDRLVEGIELKPDTLVVKLDRAITVKSEAGNGLVPFGLYYCDSGAQSRKHVIMNVFAKSLGAGSRERMYHYAYPYSARQEFSNNVYNYVEKQSPYFNNQGHYRKNNVWINTNSFSNLGSRQYQDHKCHGEILAGYAYTFRNLHAHKVYYSGNIVDAGRYLYLNSHSTPYSPGHSRFEMRNNYFVVMDYYNHYIADNHGMEQTGHNIIYYDNVERAGAGYNRHYHGMFRRYVSKHFRNEGNRMYPSIYQQGFLWRTEVNAQYYQSMGTDYLCMDPYYDQVWNDHRPYLIDNGRRMIILNKDRKNHYDIVNISFNRVDPVMVAATFTVHSQQQIRVQQKINFKNELGQFFDEYVGHHDTSTNNQMKGRLIYNNRTVKGKDIKKSLSFTEFNFDETFTAEPGDYLYILLQRNRQYCQKILTFKDMSFAVTGDSPADIEVTFNGFEQYKLIKRPDKITSNTLLGKSQKVPTRLATRGTVKLRKFKF